MLASLAAFWAGLPQWARDAIKIAGAIFALLFLGRQYVKAKEREAVSSYKNKRDKEAAEVEAAVVSQITETTDEVIRQADGVRARDAVIVLPDGSKTLPDYHFRD